MEIKFNQYNTSGPNVVNIGEKSLNFNEFSEKIKKHYIKQFSKITILHFLKEIDIKDIYVNLMIIKEKKKKEEDEEDREKLKERDIYLYRFDSIYEDKEAIDIKDLIFKSTINNTTKALIFGTAGVGKTTLCKYISYNWAIGNLFNEFELVIYLPLRDWKNNTLKENIEAYYDAIGQLNKEVNIEEILKRKVLFMFDGYDELKSSTKRHFKKSLNVVNNYIITSRPYGYHHGELSINKSFENIGFTYTNIEEYIHKYFSQDLQKATKLNITLKKNKNIYQISHIPLLLELVCYAFQYSENTDKFSLLNMAELYIEVIDNIFKAHMAKNKEIVIANKNRKTIQKLLGKLAFEGLKDKIIVFNSDFVEKVLTKEEIEYLESKAIVSGFLNSDREEAHILDNKLEFIHLTFQEYLAAYYVNCLTDEKEIESIISDYIFHKHMTIFLIFLTGLNKLGSQGKKIC